MGKTVWFVNQYAGSAHHGMEFRHYQLGLRLADRGFDVTVLSGSYSHLFQRQPTRLRQSFTELIDGLRYRWLWVPRYESPYGWGRLLNMLVFAAQLTRLPRTLPAPDVIVASSPSPFLWPITFLLARRHRARFIIEVRDLWPLSLQELAGLPPWHPLVLLMAACESFAYRTCDYAVSVLPSAESHMRSRGLARGKFRHIPNGVNVGPTDGRKALEPHPRSSLPGREFVVGFVGTFSDANFLRPLIEAARLLQEHAKVRFVLCGRGPMEEELKRLSTGLTNVAFLNSVARGEVLDVIKTFDLCYVGFRPSPLYRFGISPNKLYDYMFAARPVLLAANVPSSEVEQAECGLVVRSADPPSIAQAVLSLSGRAPADLRTMGERGRAFVLRHHDYDVLASRYVELL